MVPYVKISVRVIRPVQVSSTLIFGSACSAAWVWVWVGVWVCVGVGVRGGGGGEQPSHLDNNLCDAKHYSALLFSRERSPCYGALCKNYC